jgi:hypothetical protein
MAVVRAPRRASCPEEPPQAAVSKDAMGSFSPLASLAQPVFVDKRPINLKTKAGLVANEQMAVAQLRVLAEEPVGQWVSCWAAMGLDAEDAAR